MNKTSSARTERLLDRIKQIRSGWQRRQDEAGAKTATLSNDEVDLLKKRALQLSEIDLDSAPTPAVHPGNEILIFALGQVRYAVELAFVESACRTPSVTALAAAPAELVGITYHRGSILPIINPEELLGVAPISPMDASTLIVLKHEQQQLGLLVSEIEGFSQSTIQRLEETSLMFPRDVGDRFKGISSDRLPVLDVPELMSAVRSALRIE